MSMNENQSVLVNTENQPQNGMTAKDGKNTQLSTATQLGYENKDRKAIDDILDVDDTIEINQLAYGASLGGHHDLAEELRKEYGADILEIAQGAARSGDRGYVQELMIEFEMDKENEAFGVLYNGRQVREAVKSELREAYQKIAQSALEGNHIDYYHEILAKPEFSVKDMVEDAAKSGKFLDNDSVFHYVLGFKNQVVRDKLIKAIDKSVFVQSNVKESLGQIHERIAHLAMIEEKYALDTDQAVALQENEGLRTWLLQGYSKIQEQDMPKDLFIEITQKIAPELSAVQVEDLIVKLNKAAVLDVIEDYTKEKIDDFGFIEPKQSHEDLANGLKSNLMGNKDETVKDFAESCQQEYQFFKSAANAKSNDNNDVNTDAVAQGLDRAVARMGG